MRLFERVRGGFEHSGIWGPLSAFLGVSLGLYLSLFISRISA
nr:MAG TPA: hypothetical protein [Caudoviricetes sp.]